VLLGSNTQLIIEGVVPDLLHVVPVGDYAMFDGVSQGEDAALGLRRCVEVVEIGKNV
jgi:hypothetical protein